MRISELTRCEAVNPQTELFIGAREFHAEPTIGLDVGLDQGDQVRVMRDWFLARLDD